MAGAQQVIVGAIGIVIAFSLSTCNEGSSRDPSMNEPDERATEVVVVSDDTSLPRRCRPGRAASTVAGLIHALNRGDAERAVRFFATGSRFQWYSVTDTRPSTARHVVLETIPALLAHFREPRERLRLMEISVGPAARATNGGIAYALSGEGEEPGSPELAVGKADMDCRTGKLTVWSMGVGSAVDRKLARVAARTCPASARRRGGRAIVACAAR